MKEAGNEVNGSFENQESEDIQEVGSSNRFKPCFEGDPRSYGAVELQELVNVPHEQTLTTCWRRARIGRVLGILHGARSVYDARGLRHTVDSLRWWRQRWCQETGGPWGEKTGCWIWGIAHEDMSLD